jgi:hypothetical protein
MCVQHEAGAANVDDQRGSASHFNLFSQIADVNVHDIGLKRKVIMPYILEQHCARNYLIGMT